MEGSGLKTQQPTWPKRSGVTVTLASLQEVETILVWRQVELWWELKQQPLNRKRADRRQPRTEGTKASVRLKSAPSEARLDPFCLESRQASHSGAVSLDSRDNGS